MSETGNVILAAIVSLGLGVGIGAWAVWIVMKPFLEFQNNVTNQMSAMEGHAKRLREQIDSGARYKGQA